VNDEHEQLVGKPLGAMKVAAFIFLGDVIVLLAVLFCLARCARHAFR